MPPPTIIVNMGKSVSLIGGDAVLSTSGLSDCSALAILSNWNGHTYHRRTLMHLVGSSLERGLWGIDVYSVISRLKTSLSAGGKIILVGGLSSQSNCGLALTIGQSTNSDSMPLADLLRTKNVSIVMAGASSVSISPNGEFDLLDNGRGVLDEADVKAVFDSI